MEPVIAKIKDEISKHPMNQEYRELGWEPVFTASAQSRIVLIGQAPGIRAQLSHKPWNDISGRNLRGWLGVTDDQFYNPESFALMPMDFYYPGRSPRGGDLPPRRGFAEVWHPVLLKEMKKVELILLVGQYSQWHYLPEDKKLPLSQRVKQFQQYLPKFFPLPHPSPRNKLWLQKNYWFEEEVVPVLKKKIIKTLA